MARQWGTPRGRETFIALPEEPEQVSPREAVREMDGTVYDFAIAWPTVTLSERDMYALDLAAYILGEGESSRLVRQLKYENPLVLGVAAASNTPHFVRGYFVVTASSKPETWQKASAGNHPPGLPAPRRRDRRGRTGQGQEAEGGRTGLPAADRPAAGREPGAKLPGHERSALRSHLYRKDPGGHRGGDPRGGEKILRAVAR